MRPVQKTTFRAFYRNPIARLLALLFLVFLGCNPKPAIPASEQIQGEWISLGPKTKYFRFTGDSVEFAEGLFCRGDSSTIARISGYAQYQGHFAPFRIREDSIFYREPCLGKWRILGKIGILRNDSLVLNLPDPEENTGFKAAIFTLQKPKLAPVRNFDKIVFTEISWNYSDLTNEISVAANGDVFFTGVTWHKMPDLYYGKLDTGYVNFLFDKFHQADFQNAPDNMDEGIIDGTSTYTTLIKDGKIIKSVKHRHGYDNRYHSGIDRHLLLFHFKTLQAYNVVKYLPYMLEQKQKLKPRPSVLPVTTLDKLLFFDGTNFMELSPTEGFFFWTELQKARPVSTPFNPTYRLFCWERFFHTEKEQGKHPARALHELATDGRYYKFPDKAGKPQVYDLDYNFLERNDLKNRFKPADNEDLTKIRDRAQGIIY